MQVYRFFSAIFLKNSKPWLTYEPRFAVIQVICYNRYFTYLEKSVLLISPSAKKVVWKARAASRVAAV